MKKQPPLRICLTVLLLILSSGLVSAIHLSPGASNGSAPQATTNTQSAHSWRIPVPGHVQLVGTVDASSLSAPASSSGTAVPFVNGKGGSSPGHGHQGAQANSPTLDNAQYVTYPGFNGLNETQGGGFAPPDVQVATGPSSVVEMVNLEGAIYTKQGTLIQFLNLTAFFKTPKGDVMSDPKVLFDVPSSRWFASIITAASGFLPGNVTIAVSTSNDPTGTWNVYVIKAGLVTPDQPILGINDDKVVISTNDFSTFAGAHVWVLNKSQMTTGNTNVNMTSFGPDSALFSVHPVQSLSSTTTLYLVSVGANGTSYCVACTPELFAINGVPPGPVTINMTPLSMASVFAPQCPVEPGPYTITCQIDSRVSDAVWFQGKLWFTLNDGCTPQGDTAQRSCVRLTEVNTANAVVLQDFDYCSTGTYCYYPALRVDSQGNLAIIYGYSSASVYPSLAVTAQAKTDPLNSLERPKTIVNGTGIDNSGRYGDYFGAAVDPSDSTLFWIAGEYNTASTSCSGCWKTFIASMRVAGPNFSISDSPTFQNIPLASEKQTVITVSSVAGFSGNVRLVATPSGSGVVCWFTTLNNTATVYVPPGSYALQWPTCGAYGPGSFTVTISGTSGSLNNSIILPVTVMDYGLSAASVSFTPGSSTSGALDMTTMFGFSGTVSLSVSAPSGITVSCPSSASLTSGTISTNSCSYSSSTAGTYSVTITGTFTCNNCYYDGTDSHSTTISATVSTSSPSDFTISESPTSQAIPVASERQTIITITSVNGFSGNVNLVATPSSPAFACWFTTLTNTATVYVPSGGSGTQYPTCGAGSPGGAYGVTFSATSGSLSHPMILPVNVTDYSMSASNVSFNTGSSATGTVTLTSIYSFSGTVNISVSSPSAVSVSCPSSTSLTPGSTSTISCTYSSSSVGSFTVTITGSSTCSNCYYDGTDSHSTTMIANAVDFAIATDTPSQNFFTTYISHIFVGSESGFSGTVTLTMSITPSSPHLTATLTPTSPTIVSYGTGLSTEQSFAGSSCPALTNCFWTVTITGSSGTLQHSLQIDVQICKARGGCPQAVGTGVSSTPTPQQTSNTIGSIPTNTFQSATVTARGPLLEQPAVQSTVRLNRQTG